jgi:DNA-binding CsgD family transcriptional regulator
VSLLGPIPRAKLEGDFDEPLAMHLGDAALRLHRGSRAWPAPEFQPRAFELVRELIPFDSGMWGTASNDPHHMHSVHLDRQPREMIEEYIAGYQTIDPMRDRVSANPGVTANLSDFMTREELCASRIHREYMSRWGLECVLCTVLIEPVSSLIGFMSLWRDDPARPFSETERRIKQFLFPHLQEAYRESRLHHLRGTMYPAIAGSRAAAICDRFGVLHAVQEPFVALLREEWPHWRTARLPDELAALAGSRGTDAYRGARIVVGASRGSDLVLLEGRRAQAFDRLTPREREIAAHYASGESNQQISGRLHISAATVRNHVAALYRKLEIGNKAQLVRLVDEARPFA